MQNTWRRIIVALQQYKKCHEIGEGWRATDDVVLEHLKSFRWTCEMDTDYIKTVVEDMEKAYRDHLEGLEFIFDVALAMQDIFHYIKPELLDPLATQLIQTEDDDVYPSHQPQKRQKTSHIAAGSSSTTPSIGQQFSRFLQEDKIAGLGLSIYNGRTNMEWCSKRLLECQFSNEEELQLGIQILKEDWEARLIFMSLPLGNAKNFILTCISRS